MNAEPLPDEVEPVPDWMRPPAGGFTVEQYLALPGLPEHTELIDGGLVFVSPQAQWHSRVISLFERELDEQAPQEFRAIHEMAVRLGKYQMPEPDVVVVTAEAYDREPASTYYRADDVLLAVEAVSPESADRDRETKPLKYAKAGIQHYWRVERRDDDAIVYTYQLDLETQSYALVGIFHERLTTLVPFPIDLDLTAVCRRKR
ncbi:Uma2 family endonuclease [Nocardia halotolerans]|uniref:Uma2 family endonuclease n=1 Tax=Nocardia halotolerans TaxID=1755878 RepID=A0ABV8VM86_9NOCA